MTPYEQASRYIAKCPPAISGQSGHNTAYSVVVAIVHGFALNESEAYQLLSEWNRTCQPPWSEKELRHKIKDAMSKPHDKPRGHKLNSSSQRTRSSSGIASSSSSPRLATSTATSDAGGLLKPIKTGIFIAINPYKVGATLDKDVVDFRHALVEFDEGLSLEEQFNLYEQMRLPCAAIIYSGGKSVHAWVRVDARDLTEYNDRVKTIYSYFLACGYQLDEKNKNPGRLSRLPNCERFDGRQELLRLHCGAESFVEWLAEIQMGQLQPSRKLSELIEIDTNADPDCVIGFRDGKTLRYLCRGGAAWILGPSGIGKSSIISQFAIGWGRGEPVFGITPVRQLKSLIIQAENDDYDLAEIAQGIAAAHDLNTFNKSDWAATNQDLLFQRETRAFGQEFITRLHKLIARDKPDIVWLDPMLSFMGVDVAKQVEVTQFLRHWLTPVLESTGVVLIGVHHTGKPKSARETANWNAIDYAYAGLGSSELVNWARAIMFLRPVTDTHFELKLAKRGSRAGATHLSGEWTNSIWLRHSGKGIRWEQTDPPAEGEATEDKPERKAKPEKGVGDLIALVPVGGEILKSALIDEACRKGFTARGVKAVLDLALSPGKNGEPPSLVIHKVKRPGTNPAQMVRRS